jgi:hypothetical protein
VAFSVSTYLPSSIPLIVRLGIPFVLMGLTGILQTAYFSMSNAALLAAAPPMMRGRVVSLLSLDRAMVTLGASLAGFLTAAQGVQLAQIEFGVICVAGGIVVLFLIPALRQARMQGGLSFSEIKDQLDAAERSPVPAASARA